MHLAEIGKIVHGVIYGKKSFAVKNILPPDEAEKDDLTFVFDPKTKTKAGVIIADQKIKGKRGVIVKDPKLAMYRLLKKLSLHKRTQNISNQAIIERKVTLPKSCIIEPYVVLKQGVKIGAGTYIGANSYIDEGVIIGKHCEIYPQTIIYKNTRLGNYVVVNSHTVIGKEGFGYIKKKRYERFKHIGGVKIRDFVEIGSNVAIDKGTIGHTLIGAGTKIDNLVHIGHNVKVGKNCIIMGQVGIAGSTKIGDNVILCGQVGLSDHLEIGDNVIVYAKSGVFKSIAENKKYSGIPAREHDVALKALARLYKGL